MVCFHSIGKVYTEHNTVFRIHGGIPELFRVHFPKPLVSLNGASFQPDFIEQFILFIVIIGIIFLFAFSHLIQRRLGNKHMAFRNQLRHIPVEE